MIDPRILLATVSAMTLLCSSAHSQDAAFRMQLQAPVLFSVASDGPVTPPDTETPETPVPSIEISSFSVQAGIPFSVSPTVTGDLPDGAVWSIEGSRPNWLSISPTTGMLSANANSASSHADLRLVAAAGETRFESEPFSVSSDWAFSIIPPTDVWRVQGSRTSQLAHSKPTTSPTWSAVSKPSWLTISSSGRLSGQPTTAGTHQYTVQADAGAQGMSRGQGSIQVLPALAFSSQPGNISVEAGKSTTRSATITPGNIVGTLSYTKSGGTWPSWMSLSNTGVITVAPAATVAPQTVSGLRVSAEDATLAPAQTEAFSVTVTAPPVDKLIPGNVTKIVTRDGIQVKCTSWAGTRCNQALMKPIETQEPWTTMSRRGDPVQPSTSTWFKGWSDTNWGSASLFCRLATGDATHTARGVNSGNAGALTYIWMVNSTATPHCVAYPTNTPACRYGPAPGLSGQNLQFMRGTANDSGIYVTCSGW